MGIDEFISCMGHVMKDWRRMCKAYTTDDESCCDGCPVVDFREHGCGAIFEMEDSTDWQRYADAIRAWAAEHPEPVYETWADYISRLVIHDICDGTISGTETTVLTYAMKTHIPADIAKKLGIEPKEG